MAAGATDVGSRSEAQDEEAPQPSATVTTYDAPSPLAEARPLFGFRSAVHWQAWMLVLPVDAVLLAAPVLWLPQYAKAVLAMTAIALALLSGGGRYRARLHLSVLDEIPGVIGRLLVAVALVASVFALRHDGQGVETFLLIVLPGLGLVVLGRVATTRFILAARTRGVVAHRTLVVGGGTLAADVIELLQRHPRYGLSVAGHLDDGDDPAASAFAPHVGALADLERIVAENGIEVVLVAGGEFDEAELLDRVRSPECAGCDLLIVPRLPAFVTQTGTGDHIGSVPIMRIRTPPLDGVSWTLKRVFDVVVSAAVLVLLAPMMAICALAVRLEGGPDVIFRQARVGRDGKLFECLKFRSMRPADEGESATRWSVVGDERVGPVGRVLRRTSLDELPQLWNILRGDMTLVGPRPERPHFVEKFSSELPRYGHRHRVPSGLTGLAQVSGLRGADTPISDRARFDNFYIENWSLWLDAKVLLRTINEVLFARGR
ncbi:sugar transferase [Actinomycetospora sp. CA-053990]|uniref:sugar transferase n=1 Tax=Actinomycetospora sp. CA-053990 TaxID=3239891 RepID=UPI003D8FA253